MKTLNRNPKHIRRAALAMTLAACVLTATVPAAAAPPPELPMLPMPELPAALALSLAGPGYANLDGPFAYSGTLSVAGIGVPMTKVDVQVDGATVASADTDLDGKYAVSFTFPARGVVDVQAVAFAGLPILETRSEIGVVIVGPGELSLAGPAIVGRGASASYGGMLTVNGEVPPAHAVSVYRNGAAAASSASDAGGNFGVSLSFTGGAHTLLAKAFEGTPAATTSPSMSVTAVAKFLEVAAGLSHTCGIAPDRSVECWGYNGLGQLGDGTTTQRTTPVKVAGLANAVSIAAGHAHSCAALADGTARCWGYNANGRLGDGTTTQRLTPVTVSGLAGAVQVTAAEGHSCARLSTGGVKCWGWGAIGQLGNGGFTDSSVPVSVAGITTATKIASRGAFTFALMAGGSINAWGLGAYGALGYGGTTTQTTPVGVSGISTAVDIGAGQDHGCAVLADKTVRCWGYNGYLPGELGDGTFSQKNSPVAVTGLTGAVSIGVGSSSTCVVLTDGTAKCWGTNPGALGDGTTTGRTAPVVVKGVGGVGSLGGIASIRAGTGQTCAIQTDGVGLCWGSNTTGKVGDGSTTIRTTPVYVL